MAAEVLFEVEAVGRDLGMVRGCHFSNRKTREKANYTRIIFWTLRKNNEWRRVLFQIFWFFPMKIKIIVKKFVQVLRKLSKCEEICPSVWKFFFHTLGQIFSHLDNFFNTWTNLLTMIMIFIGKKQKIWKSTLLHSLFFHSVQKNYPHIICFFSGFWF